MHFHIVICVVVFHFLLNITRECRDRKAPVQPQLSSVLASLSFIQSYNLVFRFRITTGKRINWIIRPLSTPVAVNCSFNCWINFRFLHCILENDEKEIVKSVRKLSNNSTLTTAEWMVTVRAISVRNSRQMQFLTSKWIVPIDLVKVNRLSLCVSSAEKQKCSINPHH